MPEALAQAAQRLAQGTFEAGLTRITSLLEQVRKFQHLPALRRELPGSAFREIPRPLTGPSQQPLLCLQGFKTLLETFQRLSHALPRLQQPQQHQSHQAGHRQQ